MAKRTGATHVLNPMEVKIPEEVVKIIGVPGSGVDAAFECAGLQRSMEATIASVKPKGLAINIAMWQGKPFSLDMLSLLVGEKTIIGGLAPSASLASQASVAASAGYCNDHQDVIDLLASGKIKLDGSTH